MTEPGYRLEAGEAPLFISIPHAGTEVPEAMARALTPAAAALPDTDWHVRELYAFARGLGVGVLAARTSRYVIDLNRDPQGAALYPGADNTELCPTRSFAGETIHLAGTAPDAKEIESRLDRHFAPYHAALAGELARLRERHGYVILLDAHSIRSQVPRFFQGRLPDLNLGSADGASCAPGLQAEAFGVLSAAKTFSAVLNGRFKGGYITRHYGRPELNQHALQLEIAQAAYMDEAPPYRWDAARAAPLIALLKGLVSALLAWRP